MRDIEQRAIAAYYRAGGTDQPANASVADHKGRTYVVLSNVNGVLKVYRVRNDGLLKGLRRPPADLVW